MSTAGAADGSFSGVAWRLQNQIAASVRTSSTR